MRSALAAWVAASRPRTLPAAAAPVAIGVGLAWREGVFHLPSALGALAGALLLQIGANFANDYFDGVKGTDTPDRLGPTRAVAAGLVTPAAMRTAFVLALVAATVVGALLAWRAGWPVIAIGVASIAGAVLYTGGAKPLGYLGLGDVLVLAFFGPVAVAGTVFVQALAWRADAVVAGFGPGLLAVALLAVNNVRDVDTDRRAGKGTLAVRFGRGFARAEIVGALLGAALVPVVLVLLFGAPRAVLGATGLALVGWPAARRALRAQPGDRLLDVLAAFGRLLALYGLGLGALWAWGPA
ncbi:MAG: 1,4-dihydroxy-2-naphthoate polyprenyltransferase [Planctomycetota bacterium]